MCSNCAFLSGCFEPSSALRLCWREKPSFTSSLRTVSALIGWPIAVSVSESLSMLFDTQIRGLMGSPRMAGSTRRLSSGTSSGSVSATARRPPPAARAANLALRQRFRIEIVLAAINRRAGEPRYPRHNREPAPSCGPHLGSREQSPASLVELAADRVPAILNGPLVDHATGIPLFAEIRIPDRLSHTDARLQNAIQLLFGMS